MMNLKQKISVIPKILDIASKLGEVLHVLRALIVGYEAFINELQTGKTQNNEN